MWEKVVLNLLSNALKYTFEGSSPSGWAATTPTRSSPSPTPGSEYLPRRCPGSSNVSIASRPHGHGPPRAVESAWRWSKNWSACTVAPSPPTAGRAWARLHRPPALRCGPSADRRTRPDAGHPRDLRRDRRPVRAGSAALVAVRHRPAPSERPPLPSPQPRATASGHAC